MHTHIYTPLHTTHHNREKGYWQQILPTMNAKFDAAFLDDFPLPLDGDGDDDDAAASQQRLQAQRDERRILAAAGSRWHVFLDLVVR